MKKITITNEHGNKKTKNKRVSTSQSFTKNYIFQYRFYGNIVGQKKKSVLVTIFFPNGNGDQIRQILDELVFAIVKKT